MLNKFFINIIISILLIIYSYANANEPVDIWSIDKKESENNSVNTNLDNNISDEGETIVIEETLTNSIEEREISDRRKIVGLYDPEENGFALEMWNNTDPKKIFELSKKINNMELSEDAKNIYTKLLLTNSYLLACNTLSIASSSAISIDCL